MFTLTTKLIYQNRSAQAGNRKCQWVSAAVDSVIVNLDRRKDAYRIDLQPMYSNLLIGCKLFQKIYKREHANDKKIRT